MTDDTPNCVYCSYQLQPFEVTQNEKDELPEYMARPVCYRCWDRMERGENLIPLYDWQSPQTLSCKILT